jgi:hypothetical protein
MYSYSLGRVIARKISRRLPTMAVRVRARVRSCGICGGLSGTGADFLWVFRFPLPILIPPTAPHSSSSIIRGWYIRPNSGHSTKWTEYRPTPKKFKKPNVRTSWPKKCGRKEPASSLWFHFLYAWYVTSEKPCGFFCGFYIWSETYSIKNMRSYPCA